MIKRCYKAILFSPDGDWVSDYESDTKEEVWQKISEQGSKWFFYPIAVVAKGYRGFTTTDDRIVDEGEKLRLRTVNGLRNCKIKSLKDLLECHPRWAHDLVEV